MKIAVLVPHYGDVKARFAQCLADMVATTAAAKIVLNGAPTKPQVRTFFKGSAIIEANRTVLVNDALRWGAGYVLFCDSDMTFPPAAMLRLLAASRSVIGCNYVFRDGSGPVAARDAGGRQWERVAGGTGVDRAAFLGLGFCLLDARLFDKLAKPWFRVTVAESGEVEEGEDGFFFAQLHKAKIPVFVDHDLSAEIGHVAERELKLGGSE